MEWALSILFGAAVVLLILSFIKTKQSSKQVEQQIEEVSFTFTDELNKLQQQIRNMELDAEITVTEAGLLANSSKHRHLLREVLDLHKRKYSLESIATKTQLTKDEVEQLLTPYLTVKDEGGKVANDL
jgi:Holliday junction resolvasome RuvABC ATP-dependent DNA helicase subunit